MSLDLHLLQTVLPGNDVGGDTILTVVEEDDPDSVSKFGTCICFYWLKGHLHAIGVLRLAGVELKVLEVGQEGVLDVSLSTLLKSSDALSSSTLLLERSLDRLHVA